jgi:NADH-quinone oxidoreductase subunit K
MIPVDWILLLATVLFCIGGIGVAIRRNAIVALMSIELMLNAGILAMVASAAHHGDLSGQVVVLFIMMIAAAEASVGLAIITTAFRKHSEVDLDQYSSLKW